METEQPKETKTPELPLDSKGLADIVGIDSDLFEFPAETQTEADLEMAKKEPMKEEEKPKECPVGQVWDEKAGKCVPMKESEEALKAEEKEDMAGAALKSPWSQYEYIIIGPKGFMAVPKGTPYPMPKKEYPKPEYPKPGAEMEAKTEDLKAEDEKVAPVPETPTEPAIKTKSKQEEKDFSTAGPTFAELLCKRR